MKKLHRLAKREDIELWSQDECHFQRHGTRCRVWVPPGEKDPVIRHAPTRQSIACFGAVSLQTCSPVFNAATFESFLKGLLRRRSRNRKMVVVLDHARYHHARLLKPLLEDRQAHLELLFLPPFVKKIEVSTQAVAQTDRIRLLRYRHRLRRFSSVRTSC